LKAGLEKNKLEDEEPLVEEIPFDSERKMMTMIRRSKEQYVAYVKGAPDILLQNCSRLLVNGEEVPLGQEELKRFWKLMIAWLNRLSGFWVVLTG